MQRRSALGGEETTQQRVQRLTSALTEATRTISDIEQELRERQSTVERLRHEIETYERLKDMNEEEVEAVVDVLGVPLRREARRSFWVNAAMNFGFFVLGAVVSIITTLLID
jgi:septal ring factor EnvC (AmiA/AmiB activator)